MIDGIGVRRLKPSVLLEPIPDAVAGVDRVVDLHHDEVFAVAVVQRSLPLASAAIAICTKRASDNRDRLRIGDEAACQDY